MSPHRNRVKIRAGEVVPFLGATRPLKMLLDGHSAKSVAERLGISSATLLFRWKQQQLDQAGPVGDALDARVKEVEAELRRVERERDVLKKALITCFG